MKTLHKLETLLVLFSLGLMTAWANAEGKCGDNVSWKYRTSDKTLVLSGTGATSSGSQWSGTSYWADPLLAPTRWSDSIEYVIVENGITQLGNELFLGLRLAKKVSLPETLTAIGSNVFNGCSSMAEISIPASVKEIGSFAFYGCKSLKTLSLPEAVKNIEDGTFSDCGLEEFYVSASIEKIGSFAFMGCAHLTTITVEQGNANYDSREGCNAVIETATNTLLAGSLRTVIPATVENIGYGAFSSIGIVSIDIPSSVKKIEEYAFFDCNHLKSINLPESIEAIGDHAFSNCTDLSYFRVEWKTPLTLVRNTFYRTPLKTLVVPEGCVEAYKAADVWKDFEQIVTATGIKEGALIDSNNIDEIYNLNGVKVSTKSEPLAPGMYIVQGEKVLIK
ncbi:MAG: leucine-rich repeat domain-containing protein [Bacteroidales bacterium]|nr:leucine-rich repeat domain-containing protein [Bacteroidales bacterium]